MNTKLDGLKLGWIIVWSIMAGAHTICLIFSVFLMTGRYQPVAIAVSFINLLVAILCLAINAKRVREAK